MTQYDYDLFVIGAGSGGVRAARMAKQHGAARVAVAEEYRVGGTCVIRGCVPKKLLVYASEFAKTFKLAESYGWSVGETSFSWERLIAAKDAEIDRLSGIYSRNLNNSGVEVIEERAEFEDAHTIRLVKSGRTVTADKILIAVGGTPYVPELEGAELGISSNEAFHLESLPRHVVIAGGGYIACEFAQIFAGMGAEVCQVYRGDTVLRGFDDDVRSHVHEELVRSGVRVITHTVFEKIEALPDGRKRVHLDNGNHIDTDVVMYAIGRSPHVDGLGLDKAGVALDPNGAIKVNAYSKTTADNIYAVGDVTNRVNLTPVAIREGAAFAATVFGDTPTAYDHEDIASAVFTQPPVGSVGLSEVDARKKIAQVDVYKTSFRPMKSSLTSDASRMLMKLVVDGETQRVLGVHIVGPDAPEMIQLAGIAVKAGLTKDQYDAACAVHPTSAEELVTMKEKWTPPELKAAE
ncbi:NADPH-glutathione reductase [Maricaulis maris MCS10]|uniref:Glutathione reductase n=1 Tax=Maricaulis maris (strain MCS10) TaxID=394221 RepID=Q0AR21_MARMM|nr:glutathione-disulfide reductase [Maricaulis maris]ABI65266.1 NADPH-glutathione reductase [Maricaulis maris MCS10]